MLMIFRNSFSEIQQLRRNDTFIGDLIDISDQVDAPTYEHGGYSQDLWEQFDNDSTSICTQTSASVAGFSFRSGQSGPSLLDGDSDTETVVSSSASTRYDRTKK